MRERRPHTPENPVKEFENFEQFESVGGIPEGRFAIPYNGVPVDFLYEPVNSAKVTVVFFHGSTNHDVYIPMFAGQRVMKDIPANRLAISDPSLTLDSSQELILSWFIGSSTQPRLQFFLETVIRRIQEITGVPRFIFLGGSGGGFASLEMSRRFPHSLALVMNPQTNLANYYPRLVRQYLDLCWDGLGSLDELPGHVNHNLCEAYPRVLNHTVAYVQNTRDSHHIENHQLPFFEKVGASSRVFMKMDPWGDPKGKGHIAPPRDVLRDILLPLVESRGAWKDALLHTGFVRRTSENTVRERVKEANADLPTQQEVDVM